jgi:hypothetical protein
MKTKQQLIEELEGAPPVRYVCHGGVVPDYVYLDGYADVDDLRLIADRLEALIELEKIDKTPENK